MKIKSELIWAVLLIGTAAISFYLGTKTGTLDTEENLKIKIEQKAAEITALENKIQQLSEELTSRGIYSYPQAIVVSEVADSVATVIINLNGRDPIRNLEIERKQINYYSNDKGINAEDPGRKGKTTNVGTLNSHNPVAFELEKFNKETGIQLRFKAKGNQWHQYIRVKKNQKGEIKTFWVITNRDSEVIDKHIDQGFPVDKNGYLDLGPDSRVKYSEIKMNSIFNPFSTD